MIRRVAIESLKKGMYVLDPHDGKGLEPPLYTVEGYILSSNESARLAALGFREAWVDDSLFSLDPNDVHLKAGKIAEAQLDDIQKTFAEEREQASLLYREGVAAARTMHERIRLHKELNVPEFLPLFHALAQSLQNNKDVLLSLGKLRDKDDYTFSHSVNVGLFSMVLGRQLEVSYASLPELGLAGFFHDVGKLFVPADLLRKKGKLSADQWPIMREHARVGFKYLEEANLPRAVCLAALEHHERDNGQGYPFGKKADEISFIGQVIAVADVFDAISSKRPYQEASSPSRALSIMYQTKEADYGPTVMEAFIIALGIYPCGTLVRLSNQYWAVVTEQNEHARLRPVVVPLADPRGTPVFRPKPLNLAEHLDISIDRPVSELPCAIDIKQAVAAAYL